MKVALSVLAENVINAADGKLSVINIFGNIPAQGLPCQVPRFVLVVAIYGTREETGVVSGDLVNSDGLSVVKLPDTPLLQNTETADEMDVVHHSLMVELVNFPFPNFGRYSFDLKFNDQDLCQVPIYIKQV